jgi:hypothetical protein
MVTRGIHKQETLIAFYFLERTGAPVEIIEICAATQCCVLAIVDFLTVRETVRGRAAAQKRALFKHCNAKSSLS